MSVLVVAEHDNQTLKNATIPTLAAATQLSKRIVVLVAGFQCRTVAEEVSQQSGVETVLLADDAAYEHSLAENMAPLIAHLGNDYSHILMPANTYGKNILPRAAALLDVGQVSDVIAIENTETFQRPIYAGNAIATVKNHDRIKCLTIRTTMFSTHLNTQDKAPIQPISQVFASSQSQFISSDVTQSERPELTSAKIVISGGRGLKSQDNFQLLENIATRLNAAIGASRAAVDAGFAANDLQVGQTGKVVAPELYIAVGISGAIQHIAGMKDSKVVVAINTDPDAPIFQVADYGLVADLFEVLPELDQKLAELGY